MSDPVNKNSSIAFSLIALVILAAPAPAAYAAEPAEPRFTVTGFQITGDNPLSEKAALAVVEPYLGEHAGLEGLQSAADALESRLRRAGFSFHRVVLPPQTLQDGAVRLEVIEFPVGRIEIENNQYFDRANILNSLPPLSEGQSANVRRLSRSMRLANKHPAKNLEIGFRESREEQAVDARIAVEDRSPSSFFTVLQNSGTEETGDYRLSLGYQYSNLFNRDHQVSAVYTTSPDETDAVAQSGLNYRMPFYGHAGALSFSYTDSDIDSAIIDTAGTGDGGALFQIKGKGTVANLRYEYMFLDIGRYRHEAYAGYADKLFDNELTFDQDQVIQEASGKVRSNPFSAGYNGRHVGLNQVIGFGLEWVSNQPRGSYSDEQAYGAAADPDWSALRYSLRYDRRFAGEWLFRFRHNGQQAGETLIQGEKFGLGGAHSVRGYEERAILGDNGWQTSLEAWTPPFAGGVNALVFYDFGFAETEGTAIEHEPAGAGLGLRWNWAQQLSLRLDAAGALETVNDTEKGDSTFHLSVFYRF